MDTRNQILGVVILVVIFTGLFARNFRSDLPLIFKKDLLAHDESSNSVVAANITRKFFPPMVRTNPLVEQQGNWMEGPFWQHIPPLYAYVPYIFFQLDGQVTVEVKRLSYAFVLFLTGIIFILGVYRFRKNLLAAAAATVAAALWIKTPFTHELVTGYAFGVSDIVLAATVVISFVSILWYLREEQTERQNYSWQKIMLLGFVVALPIMAKNLLGAIPVATFLFLLFRDNRFSKKFWFALASFLGLLAIYYLPLLISSPETFQSEIMVSFLHGNNYEGWGRPWYWYVTNYLPERYLFGQTGLYFAGLLLGGCTLFFNKLERKDRIILGLSGLWFIWNLFAISMVESKIANFIFQSYFLSIFFITYSVFLLLRKYILPHLRIKPTVLQSEAGLAWLLIIILVLAGVEFNSFFDNMRQQRAQTYSYATEREKFFQTAEELRAIGLTDKDIVIVRVSDNDCWFRYNTLFLTGAESKTLLEMNFGYSGERIQQKYRNMYFVITKADPLGKGSSARIELANYSVIKFDLSSMSVAQVYDALDFFISTHQAQVDQDVLRIKKDLTACQWLVPDPILNAP